MIIKILVTGFVLFALTRVILRYRGGDVSFLAMIGWGLIWVGIDAFIWWPRVSDIFAKYIGIGRGTDALLFVSILLLFYGVFRIYIKLEFIEHEITSLVRKLAIHHADNNSEAQVNHQGEPPPTARHRSTPLP